jgi:hypothetical protein
MAKYDLSTLLSENTYPGRGIVIGKSADGKNALIAYFIMGRSENSRNRIFEAFEGGMRTRAFDESKLTDPSLIIYNPYLCLGGTDIVTNGDQTNTVYDFLKIGRSFEDALTTREFEPDHPNYTPRISGMVTYAEGDFAYKMSILKAADAQGNACARFFYEYPATAGVGHFLHTYVTDGDPIPTFQGEPERVSIPADIDALKDAIWENLDENNKISLFVRYTDLQTGEFEQRIINKNA